MGRHFLSVNISQFGQRGNLFVPSSKTTVDRHGQDIHLVYSVGSSPTLTANFAPVAQLVERKSRTEYSQDVHNLQEGGRGGERVCLFLFRDEQSSEHRTNNSVVGGSSPSGGTISVE